MGSVFLRTLNHAFSMKASNMGKIAMNSLNKFSKYAELISIIILLLVLYVVSLNYFLLFHSLVEIFSIVVACSIFVIAWNSRNFIRNNYLLFLGIAYLFIAIIDIFHTISYKGMGVLSEYDSNLPTQFWILARYVEGISLLFAPLMISRKLNANVVFLFYSIITLLLTGLIFTGYFPDCFIEGVGLTTFKIFSEYIISSILVFALIHLLINKDSIDANILKLLSFSIILTILAELSFTFYVSVYGLSNILGHFFKLISFYFVYKAVIVTGLSKPYALLYRELKTNEVILQQKTASLEALSKSLKLVNKILRHDVVNDLNIVQMAFDNMGNGRDSEMLAMSEKAVNRSLRLIRNMRDLDMTMSTDEKLDIYSAGDFVLSSIGKYDVSYNINGECLVKADSAFNSVIDNIINNAIVHGKSDHIDISITDNGDVCRIEFADDGIGIPDDVKKRVFEDGFKYGETGHTGFGLFIVKKIIEHYDGKVWVEDNNPKGSKFIIELDAVSMD